MSRFKLTVEYVGTRYRGWQIQKNARTVQGELALAAREATGRGDFELMGSGRTDAGVHALAQVAHLDVATTLEPHRLRMALNDALPADINVLSASRVPRRFHARHDAVGRSYLYQIARRRTAFGKPLVWWIRDELDVAAMQRAAALFVGLKDFRSFTEDEPEEKSTRVKVERLELAEAGALVLVRIRGSHFVWKMVRRIVGVLAEVGRGGLSLGEVERFLREDRPEPARLTAPPSGLFLERVLYAGDPTDWPLRPVLELAP
jgi:tRNA pseudouridine38-40 synthase